VRSVSEYLRGLALLALTAAVLAWGAGATALNRGALLHIVQTQCLPRWRAQQDPAPCLQVTLPDPGGEQAGYAVLPDRKGGAHFLLIPTRRLSGIESPELLNWGTTNYFDAAWQARTQVERFVGKALPRDAIGLAINPRRSRGQDQLHIHIECLGSRLQAQLKALNWWPDNEAWQQVKLGRDTYQARVINGENLGRASPFQLVAEGLPGSRENMGPYTLLLAGWQFADGTPGFILLADASAPGSETLLDSACLVAR
jgi:CDP-diacylglycerol pyrophosphatase